MTATITEPTIYRVTAIDQAGKKFSHLIKAKSARVAIDSVLAADTRLARVLRAVPVVL